ncbi:MAG: AI-2E family transporter, partial [Muribaculaceae bacterium]|nr:AI-2E family transporter [Muribaculaceae bacterium]
LNRRWMHCRGRAIPVFIALVDVAIIVGVVVYLFVPSIISDCEMLGDILHDYSSGQKQMPELYQAALEFCNRYFSVDSLSEYLTAEHVETLLRRGTSILQESIDILAHTLEWLLTFIYIVFILIDYPQISNGFKLALPHQLRPQALAVMHDIQLNMNHYFRGQGVVALCAAVFYCIGFRFVGIPLAIPLGILVGILYMIPYFQYVTLIPVAVICFIYSLGGDVDFLPEFGKCCLVYVCSQMVCDYVITPHIMGREMGLNPAIILLSLSVWGSLMGIIGMILALPLTSLIMSYYEKYISFPPQDSEQLSNGPTESSSSQKE